MLRPLGAGAAYAWAVGTGVGWDWRNYHYYGAYAYLNGRDDLDVAVTGIQTFLNPLAYVPAYVLQRYLPALLAGMTLGALHGLNLALIYGFARLTLAPAANRWTSGAAVVIAAFSPMALSEVGTSFADITTVPLIVTGLYLLLLARCATPGALPAGRHLHRSRRGTEIDQRGLWRRRLCVAAVRGAAGCRAAVFCDRCRPWGARYRRRPGPSFSGSSSAIRCFRSTTTSFIRRKRRRGRWRIYDSCRAISGMGWPIRLTG